MRNPLAALTRPRTLWIGGFAFASVSVLIVARIFAWNLLLVILLLLAIVLLSVIVMLVRQLRKVRAAEEIEKTIGRQADRDIEKSVPGQQAQVQNLKAELLAAIEALKKTKSGKQGESVLSTLPWVMLVGPTAAGKSEFMARSGLHFPLMDSSRRGRSVKGIGGTRAFEWWLSQEAVVLDMGGRTLSASAQFEDNDDWFAFLDVLKQQRPKKPLNGVIVAMAVDQLADKPDAAIDKVAGAVRERVQELVERLGVVFPVYVVFTKADLIAGFAESFGDLASAERGQAWGATVAMDRSRDVAAEELFDEEFSHLTASAGDRRTGRLGTVPDPMQRARLFAFPAQLERVRPALRRFVRGVFAPDPTRADTALFRGFYLSSALQEGTPADRVLEPAARAAGLAAVTVTPPPQTSGAWFVHDLLTRVVFADADLASASRSAIAARRRGKMFLLAGVGVAFLAVALLLVVLATVNSGLTGRTRRAAQDVSEKVTRETGLYDKLTELETLRKNLVELEANRKRTPWWRALGAYSGHPLIEPGVRLYADRAIESLIRPAVEGLQLELRGRAASGNPGDLVDFYTKFRAWHLLRKPSEITPDDSRTIVRAIQKVYDSQLAAVPADARTRVPALIGDQVAFLAAHPDVMERLIARYYPPDDPALLAQGRAALQANWDSKAFYRDLVERLGPGQKTATLATLAPNVPVLSASGSVPGLYTREAWTRDVKPEIDWWRANVNRDYVLRDAFSGTSPDVAGDLTAAYSADFTAAWNQFLAGVELGGGDAALGENLKILARADSPLLKVLKAVGEQTLLGADADVGLGEVRRDFALVHNFFAAQSDNRAGNAMATFNRLIGRRGSRVDRNTAPSDLYVQELQRAEKKFSEVAQPGVPADQVRALLAEGDPATNPVKGARAWVDALSEQYAAAAGTEATARVLALPADQVLGAISRSYGSGLTRKFEELVLGTFRSTLGTKYPFNRSGPDVSPYEFNEFFRATGVFWTFYNAELKPLVNPDGSAVGGPSGSAVPPEVASFLRMANDIREAFYGENPEAASLKFSVRTSAQRIERPPGSSVRWVSFDVGGSFATYNMGPPVPQPLAWPGSDAALGAALRVLLAGGVEAQSLNFPGPWGVFHLVDKAAVTRTAPNAVEARWTMTMPSGAIIVPYEIQTESPKTPFARGFWTP